jgi:cytochrome c5
MTQFNFLTGIVGMLLLLMACTEKDPDLEKGQAVFMQYCKVCHAQGINGAPVFGNKKNWASRKQQELVVLVDHAANGYGLMPANLGRGDLTKDDITVAIKYMLSAVEDN